jgi:hypothetical protein
MTDLELLRDTAAIFLGASLPKDAFWRVNRISDWPEIEIIWQARIIFLKLAPHPGHNLPSAASLTEEEKRLHGALMTAGAHVWIVHNVADIKSILRNFFSDSSPGLPPG